MSSNTTKSV
ncbi:hypothetical protein Tco_1511249, partial [Tanacetum coccineum]